jgi:hypothetical protein
MLGRWKYFETLNLDLNTFRTQRRSGCRAGMYERSPYILSSDGEKKVVMLWKRTASEIRCMDDAYIEEEDWLISRLSDSSATDKIIR